MSPDPVLSRFLPLVSGRRFPVRSLLAVALAAAAILPVQAGTPGSIDPAFVAGVGGTAMGGTIYSLFRYDYVDATGMPTDFLVAGGDTELFDPLILPIGTIAITIAIPNFGDANRIIYTIAQDKYTNPDKYFIGGSFGLNTTQIVPRVNILRINSDFTIDAPAVATDGRPVFDSQQGANEYVTAILPTIDGKLVVGGLFTAFNNISHQHIVRLTDNANILGIPDGTIDAKFDPNLAFDSNVLTLAEQLDPATGRPNGQYLVGGLFNNVNSTPATKLARINNDGSVDTTFHPAIDQRVNIVVAQPDGKMLIGGDFTTVDGVAQSHLARLNYDGSLDPTFSADVRAVPAYDTNPNVSVFTITLLADGRMYVGGNFIMINGVSRNYLALLHADGSVDPTFDPGTNVVSAVQSILPDSTSSGDVYVAETASSRLADGKFPPTVVALFQPSVNGMFTPVFTNVLLPQRVPNFFAGSTPLGSGFLFLQFANKNIFGYYDLDLHPLIYHEGLGFEYVFDANDGQDGIYLYDYASGHYFYTSPTYSFPFLYDFTLNSVLYLYPNPSAAGFFITNAQGQRLFHDFATGQDLFL